METLRFHRRRSQIEDLVETHLGRLGVSDTLVLSIARTTGFIWPCDIPGKTDHTSPICGHNIYSSIQQQYRSIGPQARGGIFDRTGGCRNQDQRCFRENSGIRHFQCQIWVLLITIVHCNSENTGRSSRRTLRSMHAWTHRAKRRALRLTIGRPGGSSG